MTCSVSRMMIDSEEETMTRRPDPERLRNSLMRSNTSLLLSAVLLFQFTACLLMALHTRPIDSQALLFALTIPAGTWIMARGITCLWPVDRAIVILTLLLVSIGIITLKAIARSPETPATQAIYTLPGCAALLAGAWGIRLIRSPKKWRTVLMVLCVLALLSPWALGKWNNGARNWVYFKGLSIQPSEFMKPVFILILASGMAEHPRFKNLLPTIGFAAVCCGILLSQRDLGAVLLYFLTTVTVFFVATSNLLLTLGGLGMGAAAGVIAVKTMPYVARRFALWKDPWSDAQNYGYQLVQSLIAIGSGGLFGSGLQLGSPRNIPFYHTDFIFAAMTEEFGLVFSVCLLALYVILVMRGLIAAMNARNSFLSLSAFGIVTILALQTMLIVGGNTQLLPLTGVTLPLISAGGSSLVSTMFSIGILCGITALNAEEEAKDIEWVEMSETGF